MLFQRKKAKQAASQEKDLYPILHVANSLKEYQKELVQKEVDSLLELSMVGKTFDGVLGEAVVFQTKLEDFGEQFSSINQVSDAFSTVKTQISESVLQAQSKVGELQGVSRQVESHFNEMGLTFPSSRRISTRLKTA